MDADDWQHVIFALIALVVLALAGVVLTAVGQATNQRLLADAREGGHRNGRTTTSVLNPRRSIGSGMLFIQLLATVVAAGQLVALFDGLDDGTFGWVMLVTIAAIYLVFGVALPRAIAEKIGSDAALERIYGIGRGATTLLRPVAWIVERLVAMFQTIIPGTSVVPESIGTEDELRVVRVGHDDGVIGEIERQMIDGILSLEEMTVRDIMVPRLDIVALDRRISPQEMIDTITKAGHSRIPVYRDSIDNVLGVLYVKDLLPFVIGNTIRIPLLDLIRPAFVVPESKKLPELFTELKRTRIHLAIVADEYGGTAGLITIEDILEEIVGEIQDEYDTEEPLFRQEGPDSLIADGRLPIEDVEDALDLEFEDDDDFGTLGGFVHKHLGRLAVQGDTFEAENVRVEILEVERHRVKALRITRLPEPEEPLEERSHRRRRGGAASEEPGDTETNEDQ